MPVDHYENFPVASFLLPNRLVPAVEAIYAFARSADDLADEGDAAPAERLAALDALRSSAGRHRPRRAAGRPDVRAAGRRDRAIPACRCSRFTTCCRPSSRMWAPAAIANFAALLDYCRALGQSGRVA